MIRRNFFAAGVRASTSIFSLFVSLIIVVAAVSCASRGPAAKTSSEPVAVASKPSNIPIDPSGAQPMSKADFLKTTNSDDPAVIALAETVESKVEEARKLKFKEPVRKAQIDRKQLLQYLEIDLRENADPVGERVDQVAFELFGLLESGQDLMQISKDLQTNEIAGFYDPEVKALFVLKDSPDDELDEETMAHELCHALEDQYYNLKAVDDELEKIDRYNNDRNFAWASVCEGSAMLLTIQYGMEGMNFSDLADTTDMESVETDPAPEEDPNANEVDARTRPMGAGELHSATDMMNAPPILTRSLMDRYISGATFLTRAGLIVQSANDSDLERAFADPPLSSEQIYHPEKYWDPKLRDDPRIVKSEDVTYLLGKNWKKIGSNVLGEIGVAVLTDETEEEDAAGTDMSELLLTPNRTTIESEGWDGDLYTVYENNAGAAIVVWTSVWDAPIDAKQMEAAVRGPEGVLTTTKIKGDQLVAVYGRGVEKSLLQTIADRSLATLSTQDPVPLKIKK